MTLERDLIRYSRVFSFKFHARADRSYLSFGREEVSLLTNSYLEVQLLFLRDLKFRVNNLILEIIRYVCARGRLILCAEIYCLT